MKRSSERILTTHAGSLIRTPEIVDAMIGNELGKARDEQAFESNLRRGVAEVVRRQAEAGVDIVSDGEYGKTGWIQYVTERLSGFEPRQNVDPSAPRIVWPEQDRYGEFYGTYQRFENTMWLPETPSKAEYRGGSRTMLMDNTGPLEYRPAALQRDIANFKTALEDVQVEEAFMPVAAPCSVEVLPSKYYKSEEEYLFALADGLTVEYRMIVDAGFLLQVDDAFLPMQYFLRFRDKPPEEYHKWAEVRVEALNHALKGIPEDRVRYHICWGSQNIPHTTDPALRDIIDVVLKVNAQAYSIEAANPRHEWEWQIWKDVKLPEGKILIPGVISHATNIVEHPELVAQRIANFASLVGRENVIAGTDCGFSQFWNLVRVHSSIQWAKLEALAQGARLASERLWNRSTAPVA